MSITALTRLAIEQCGRARQDIVGIDWSKVFVLLLAMQDTRHVNANFRQTRSSLPVAPETKHGRRGWRNRHVGIARLLRGFATMINRVHVSNGGGQFVNFVTLHLVGKRGQILTNFTCIEHTCSFALQLTKHENYACQLSRTSSASIREAVTSNGLISNTCNWGPSERASELMRWIT